MDERERNEILDPLVVRLSTRAITNHESHSPRYRRSTMGTLAGHDSLRKFRIQTTRSCMHVELSRRHLREHSDFQLTSGMQGLAGTMLDSPKRRR